VAHTQAQGTKLAMAHPTQNGPKYGPTNPCHWPSTHPRHYHRRITRAHHRTNETVLPLHTPAAMRHQPPSARHPLSARAA
jgi:hypothetical protein